MLTMHLIRLTDLEDPVIDNICYMLKNAYSVKLSKFFIYKDPNYRGYLRKLITSQNVYVFYASEYASDRLTGFVLFEIENNVVYMRNIVVDNDFKTYNIGARIFYTAIEIMMQQRKELNRLYLDAFSKNNSVINWYHSIGMKISNYLYWYDITDVFETATINNSDIDKYFSAQFITDEDGFKQLVFRGQEIGTLIQEKYLVVKILLTRDLINCISYCFFSKPLLAVCLMSNEVLDLKLIEKSIQLVIDLRMLKIETDI